MFVRRREGKLHVISSYRDDSGKPQKIDLGLASEDDVKLVKAVQADRQARREHERKLKGTVKALDQLLDDQWNELLAQVTPVFEKAGLRNERSQWRSRRKFYRKPRGPQIQP